MKLVILPALLALTVTFAAGQKTEKVTMTGSVTGVKVEKDRQGKHFYRIQLYLSVRNDSGQRLILFRPQDLRYLGGATSIEMIGKKGDATDSSSSTEHFWIDAQKYVEAFGYDSVPDSLNRLASQELSASNQIALIEPGGYFEFSDSLSVSKGFTHQPSVEDPGKLEAKPDFRTLKVKYFLKVTRPHVPDELFRRLQRKWSSAGHLPLTKEGHFSLESEEIQMVIPK